MAAAMVAGGAAPANATGSQTDVNLHYGLMSVKAWHCTLYVTACDWRSETIVEPTDGTSMMDEVTNVAILSTRGFTLKEVHIEKNPEATLVFPSIDQGKVEWTKRVSNNVANFGQFKDIKTDINVNVRSCGSGDGPGEQGPVSEKCVEVGAV
ncbi:hypothetical protein P0W64_06270 [Tsukamurella sp. 8F]|uniref:hypothetical protein n=1 Tax=unclassified Tsukamurella TaxID=2633480 RepID=UPI0023B94E11|nr:MULTISPECIES: hypothetical protein [unclassified Tsukamurella]MDF0530058.1 hypothetical protein [Tsukamurella sp. 8J]MDF0586376.1 hypothetical protein [Tsukamurella sp. 8F]